MRLNYIANLIDKCEVMMDVGCDHGLLSKLALDRKLASHVIATDISENCLKKAKMALRGYENVTFIVGDGIVETEVKPDLIAICGMGGHTISEILGGYNGGGTLILSPHSHPEQVRAWLANHGYKITHDSCYADRGKYYDIIKAVTGKPETQTELNLKYGDYMTKNNALKARLQRMLSKLPQGSDKSRELIEVLKWQE